MPLTEDLQILERTPDRIQVAELEAKLAAARTSIEQLRSLLTRSRNQYRQALAEIEQLTKMAAGFEEFGQTCAGLKFIAEARVLELERENEQLKQECDEERFIALEACDKRNIAVVEAETEKDRLWAVLEQIYKQATEPDIIQLARAGLNGES